MRIFVKNQGKIKEFKTSLACVAGDDVFVNFDTGYDRKEIFDAIFNHVYKIMINYDAPSVAAYLDNKNNLKVTFFNPYLYSEDKTYTLLIKKTFSKQYETKHAGFNPYDQSNKIADQICTQIELEYLFTA
jgi:hypothetical protein